MRLYTKDELAAAWDDGYLARGENDMAYERGEAQAFRFNPYRTIHALERPLEATAQGAPESNITPENRLPCQQCGAADHTARWHETQGAPERVTVEHPPGFGASFPRDLVEPQGAPEELERMMQDPAPFGSVLMTEYRKPCGHDR